MANCERHVERVRDLDHRRGCREAMRPCFAEVKGGLLDRRLVLWQAELARLNNRHQFGLEWRVVRSRSCRFVVIDEAFGRGSDESARYGPELFKRMNLQLLIVTPLQKIHIIEPYVAGLGFVHSEEGRQSLLRYLTIGEYQAERDARVP